MGSNEDVAAYLAWLRHLKLPAAAAAAAATAAAAAALQQPG
jgi:hypothetical protein